MERSLEAKLADELAIRGLGGDSASGRCQLIGSCFGPPDLSAESPPPEGWKQT